MVSGCDLNAPDQNPVEWKDKSTVNKSKKMVEITVKAVKGFFV